MEIFNMSIIILCCVSEIFMTFLCMVISSFTFDGFCCDMFDECLILLSLFWWWILIPCCVMIWLIRLIAYPFRKEWW